MAGLFREGVILSGTGLPAEGRISRNRRKVHSRRDSSPPLVKARYSGMTRQLDASQAPAGSVVASLYFASDKRSGRMTERSRT